MTKTFAYAYDKSGKLTAQSACRAEVLRAQADGDANWAPLPPNGAQTRDYTHDVSDRVQTVALIGGGTASIAHDANG